MADIEFPDMLFDMATSVLAEVNNQFTELGVDLPNRQYISIGGVEDNVHDCEQVTVTIEQHYPGTPTQQAEVGATCQSPRTLAMSVEIVRCTPAMESKGGRGGVAHAPPSPEKLTEYGKVRARDMLILGEVGAIVSDRFYADQGYINVAPGNGMQTGGMFDVAPGAPSGTMQGVILNLVVIVPTW